MSDIHSEIAEIFSQFKADGLFTHGFAAHGRLGDRSYDFVYEDAPDGRRLFDLASLTKAIVTTPLVFAWRDLNKFAFGGTVFDWLGDKAADLDLRLRGLSIESLLRHESGLPAWRNWWVCRTPLVEGLNRAAQALDDKPKQVYSDVGFLLLGLVVERLGQASLSMQFERLASDKLAFSCEERRFHYGTRLKGIKEEAIGTGYCAIRRRDLVGEVHDENCWSLGGETAHAGVFGTGRELVAYLRALWMSPFGQQLISENASRRVLIAHEPPNQPCLGWRQGSDQNSCGFHAGKAIGHMGFTGTAFWVYPETGDYAILLTNRIVSGRINPAIGAMRRAVFTAFGRRQFPAG